MWASYSSYYLPINAGLVPITSLPSLPHEARPGASFARAYGPGPIQELRLFRV